MVLCLFDQLQFHLNVIRCRPFKEATLPPDVVVAQVKVSTSCDVLMDSIVISKPSSRLILFPGSPTNDHVPEAGQILPPLVVVYEVEVKDSVRPAYKLLLTPAMVTAVIPQVGREHIKKSRI